MAQLRELVELIAKKLVEHPEDVRVRVIENNEGQVLELRVHPDDMGKVIGKSGRTVRAIRTIVNSAATKADIRVVLQVLE